MTVLVLHDLGEPDGGAAWRAAAPDGWTVLDLPGHGTAAPPRQGHYDPMAAVTLARWTLGDAAAAGATAVGVGDNAHAALILAAGGGCARVVIVDGLWGALPTPEEAVAETYATIRAVVASAPATAPAPADAVDPRTRHGYGVSVAESFLRRFWGAVAVPVLAVETPRSPTPPEERAERVAWFGGPVTLVALGEGTPGAVVDAVAAWRPS